MKKISIVAISLALLFLGSCSQPAGYPTGEELAVSWKLISNNFADSPRAKAVFTIENKSAFTLNDDNWAMFFSQTPRNILKNEHIGTVTHINGDWYKLEPNSGFALKPGEKAEFIYEAAFWWIKEADAPQGIYFVFKDKLGNEKSIAAAADYTIEPFTEPEQLNRFRNDEEPIPSAKLFYEKNLPLTDIPEEQLPPIIPTPVSVKNSGKKIAFTDAPEILYEKGLEKIAKGVADFAGKIAYATVTPSEAKEPKPNSIFLCKKPLKINNISNEAYKLEIKENRSIIITGNDDAGVLYGIQSLIALLPPQAFTGNINSVEFPVIAIEDAPRFGFRSLHFDVSRNFQEKETVKKMIDLISFYKLNHMMLILSEDEAWRLEIDGLPELTEIASRRGHTTKKSIDMLPPAYGSGPFADDPHAYGSGFYTRNDYKEIIRYAADRNVTIIPTINLPGHSRAAIVAMEARYRKFIDQGDDEKANEFRLIDPDDKSEYSSAQAYDDNIVCVARESVYRFYEKVIDEIIAMHNEAGVPLKMFHTGGDEIPEGAWAGSPLCKELMKSLPEITDPRNLQAYFVEKVVEILRAKDLKIGGWEEVGLLKNDNGRYVPNPKFVGKEVYPWVWNSMGDAADLAYRQANAGYPVVLCDVSNLYLDMAYNKAPYESGLYWGGFVDVRDTWQFAPYNSFVTNLKTSMGKPIDPETEFADMERLTPAGAGNIFGLQAQMWSETIRGPEMMEYCVLPKIIGFAETAWTKQRPWENEKNPTTRKKQMDEGWNIFANALGKRELPRLAGLFLGFNYRVPQPGGIIENGELKANVEYPGLIIRYTTDGSDPDSYSAMYEKPVKVSGHVKLKAFDKTGRGSRAIDVADK